MDHFHCNNIGAWLNTDFENMVEGFRIAGSERHYFVNFPDKIWIHNSDTYNMFPELF